MDRRILVVDDNELICEQLSHVLARDDRRIKVAPDGTTALEWMTERNFSIVLTDLCLPGISGLDLIREIRERDLPATVIVMTGHASIDSAVEAMKLGAYDYLTKPIDLTRLDFVVEKALADRKLQDEVRALRQGLHQRLSYHSLIGKSGAMRDVFARVARVSASNCTVLIAGETGTGKELVAQAIHYNDASRQGPLVAVNCAAIPESLLESEFFGHEKGAFTGADRQKKGRFEQASGGTLLLDEIAALPAGDAGQAAPRLAGWDLRAGGRRRDDPGRRPDPGGDQRRPGRGGGRGSVSRGSLLPPQRGLGRAAAAS